MDEQTNRILLAQVTHANACATIIGTCTYVGSILTVWDLLVYYYQPYLRVTLNEYTYYIPLKAAQCKALSPSLSTICNLAPFPMRYPANIVCPY